MASAWISWYYMSDEDFKKETEARRARSCHAHELTLRKEVGMKKCMLAIASSALLARWDSRVPSVDAQIALRQGTGRQPDI